MLMIDTVPCPRCRRLLELPEGMFGQSVQCPSCEARFEARPGSADVSATDDPASPSAAAATISPIAEGQPQAAAPTAGRSRRSASRRSLTLPVTVDRPRYSPGRVVALVVVVIVASWTLLRIAAGLANMGGNAWQAAQEDDEERRREIIAAFQRQKPLAPDEMTKEITPLFEQVRDAFKGRKSVVAHFDLDRMLDEVKDQGLLPPEVARTRREFLRGMEMGMDRALKQQAELDVWTSFEIRSLKKLQGNEAVVFVRHQAADGTITKMRWWVSKRSGQWKVYDYEDLDVGMRVTALVGSLVGSLVQGGIQNVQAAALAMKNVGEAMMAWGCTRTSTPPNASSKPPPGSPCPSRSRACGTRPRGSFTSIATASSRPSIPGRRPTASNRTCRRSICSRRSPTTAWPAGKTLSSTWGRTRRSWAMTPMFAVRKATPSWA